MADLSTPTGPCVIVCPGDGSANIYLDDYRGARGLSEPPIVRAVTVARLRALADVIEGGES